VALCARHLLPRADIRGVAPAGARGGDEATGDLGALTEGVELTQRQFLQVLEKHGVARIEAEGQKLDPNLHQAMMQIDDADAEPGTVVQVMQVGYTIHDRLLRPAMVGVAKAPDATAKPDTGQHLDTEA
ncbi:MAG: nucleotide exchange factor GrpE, partial [Alphaproteobacteria bacterium]|nr:nucleotide exchange factor GrpE [Alphaproteobacteria bacterium]